MSPLLSWVLTYTVYIYIYVIFIYMIYDIWTFRKETSGTTIWVEEEHGFKSRRFPICKTIRSKTTSPTKPVRFGCNLLNQSWHGLVGAKYLVSVCIGFLVKGMNLISMYVTSIFRRFFQVGYFCSFGHTKQFGQKRMALDFGCFIDIWNGWSAAGIEHQGGSILTTSSGRLFRNLKWGQRRWWGGSNLW